MERDPFNVELDELHLDHAVVRHDRERRKERSLQAFGLALLRSNVLLKESHVGILLHREQVGDVQDALAFSEVLSDPLAFGKAIGGCLRHTHSVSTTRSLAGEAHLVRRLAFTGPPEIRKDADFTLPGRKVDSGRPVVDLGLRPVAW